MIITNLYNPIPLHTSTDYWYENKKTYHGVDRYPVAVTGKIQPFVLTATGSELASVTSVSVKIINAVNSTQVATTTINVETYSVGSVVKSIYAPLTSVLNMVDGIYYLEVGVGSTTLYSEPFRWVSKTIVDDYVLCRYRRSSPISVNGGYVFFPNGRELQMYIPKTEIMMPEYKYDTEVEELDGVKFVRKKVSYKQFKFSFLCTDYLAEAIRLMWHCNDVTITQHGEKYAVDYMEAPSPSWNDDNHLMQMDIQFQTDTIMQTNGDSVE